MAPYFLISGATPSLLPPAASLAYLTFANRKL